MSIRPERGFFAALRSLWGRFGWGIGDQALSSLTNFAVGLVAARTLRTEDFGAFAVVFAIYLVALGVARAATSEPMVIRFSAVSEGEWRRGVASATGASALIGMLGGVVAVMVGAAVGGAVGTGLLALGLTMPGLLLQDTWRFGFFAARRGASSFINDLVWSGALIIGLGGLVLSGEASVSWFVFVWGGAATIAGLAGILQAGSMPRIGQSFLWIRQQRDLVPRFLGEFSVTTLVGQVTVFALGAAAGLAEVGALRAGQILLGPLNVLFLGVSIVAVPEGVRALLQSPHRLLRTCRRLSMVLAGCALILGSLLWSLPGRIGTAILKDNWLGAHSVIIPLALGMALSAFLLGAGVGLRSLAAARLSLRARILTGPLSVAGGLGGAVVAGATGAAWGLALALLGGAVIWWRYFLRGLRDYLPGNASSTSPEARVLRPDAQQSHHGGSAVRGAASEGVTDP